MAEPVLKFSEVTKRFGDYAAVNGVSFELQPGEFFTLLGPSGCGKSTTLRLAAGLESPDEGEILLNGVPIASPKRGLFVPPDKRRMGMVFQSYAIWPHMTVFENVAFPLRVRGEAAASMRKKVGDALEIVGLTGFEQRGATELSGGQQQRVALARALVYTPTLLLLDEPLSNLDAKLREQMRTELHALQQRLKLTVLYVTHDQTEAMTLSDRIAVVRQGTLEQIGSPVEIYERPATPFVGNFLGRTVTLDGKVRKRGGATEIEIAEQTFRLDENRGDGFAEGAAVRVLSRPEDIEILPPEQSAVNSLKGRVTAVAYLGERFEYTVNVGGYSLLLAASKRQRYAVGAEVCVALDPNHLMLLPLGS
jgi:ABC-type Fe3+/spermidine/putrescine transport system ATPase subunit